MTEAIIELNKHTVDIDPAQSVLCCDYLLSELVERGRTLNSHNSDHISMPKL